MLNTTLKPVTPGSFSDEAKTTAEHMPPRDRDLRPDARYRLDLLFDADTFVEVGTEVRHRRTDFGLANKVVRGDGVITGFGNVDGKRVYAYSQDRAAFGGALGESHAKKITHLQEMALRDKAPMVCINDSGGARIQEGVDALAGYGAIFHNHVAAAGKIPQIAVIAGSCAGGAAYGPTLCDLTVMVEGSTMFLTGPRVVEKACMETVTAEDLGGVENHGKVTGLAHLVTPDDYAAIAKVRLLLRYLTCPQETPHLADVVDPGQFVPADGRKVYAVQKVIKAVVDKDSFLELQPGFARNVVVGFARINGGSVGIVANNPMRIGGVLDAEASRKAARFIRMCDAYGLPIVTLVDVPGFLPGLGQERANVIGHGSKLLYAYCESKVPKVSIVLRKAYGGSYIVMSSRSIGGDYCFAWAGAEIAVMGKEGAAEILYRKEIAASADPEATTLAKQEEYAEWMLNPMRAAEHGHLDAIITPAETRRTIVNCLRGYEYGRGREGAGNISL